MPVVDGRLDIRARRWCSILEAVLWIEVGEVPIDLLFMGALKGRTPMFGFNDSGQNLGDLSTYPESAAKLYAALCEGGVKARGRRTIGPFRVELDPIYGDHYHATWGDVEEIHPERFIESSFYCMWSRGTQVLADNYMYSAPDRPATAWAYSQVEIDFATLGAMFRPAEMQRVRLDGPPVVLVEAETDLEPEACSAGDSVRKPGRQERKDWPLLTLLTAIIRASEDGSPEVSSDDGLTKRLKLILEAADYEGSAPVRSLLKPRVFGPLDEAMRLYKKGCRKSPPKV